MSMAKNQVVQAQCPGCKNTLRIPANWVHEPMKCKSCGMVFQAKPPKKKRFMEGAIRAATVLGHRIKRKKKKKDRPGSSATPLVGRPHTPPPGVPTAAPAFATGNGAVPTAKAVNPHDLRGGVPVAMPVGGMNPAAPAFANITSGGGKKTGYRRRSRGGWQKMAFVLIFFLGVGALGAIVYDSQPDLVNNLLNQVALGTAPEGEPEGTTPATTGATTPTAQPETKVFGTKPDGTKVDGTKPKATMVELPPIKETMPISTKPKVFNTRPTFARPLTSAREADPRSTRPGPTGSMGFPTTPGGPVTTAPRPPDPSDLPPVVSSRGFPRRLMAVSVNNYPYANPVSYGGTGGKAVDRIVRQFGELMRVPDDQIITLSDRAPSPYPTTKTMIQNSISQFLDTCRPMDRAILMLIGHGVEIEGQAYFMPMLGEADNKDTLIPLDWIYQKLATCPAQQKLLVVDVCRFDPNRGEERGKVEKMSDMFEAQLQNPPPGLGIQVLTACTAGQYSYEFDNNAFLSIEGGVFLNQIADIRQTGGLRGIIQKPEDPLPVVELARAIGPRTSSKVKAFLKSEQTPRLFGDLPQKATTYDAKATVPGRIKLAIDQTEFPGGVASKKDVESLLALPEQVPPVKQGEKGNTLKFENLPPYAKNALAGYMDDGKENQFQQTIKEAVAVLKTTSVAFQEQIPPPPDNPQQKGQFNQNIQRTQEQVALAHASLEQKLEELKEMAEDRAKESKRWQANYDYVVARLLARIAYIYEYNAMLGKVRKDELPARDPNIHKLGYRLASKVDMADREAAKIAKESQKYLDKIANEHKNTPWELIAKREKVSALGLQWLPH